MHFRDVLKIGTKKKKEKLFENFRTDAVIKRMGLRYIKMMPLTGLGDVKGITEELNQGNIVILNLKHFLSRSGAMNIELKRAVQQLAFHVKSVQGDIGQLGEHYVVVAPDSSVKIFKETSSKS
ncbi:MAG: cell division protein SepF [Candidatus Helarchaeota archaeon]